MSKEEFVSKFMKEQNKRKIARARKLEKDYRWFKTEMVYKTKRDHTRRGY